MPPDGDMALILVENTTKALQDLAAYYLSLLPLIKKIGVTGSVGKTSTRDLMYYVASTKYKTGRNKKNYNNSHGLPLSILEFVRIRRLQCSKWVWILPERSGSLPE